jgi:hypothetical protein
LSDLFDMNVHMQVNNTTELTGIAISDRMN